VFNLPYPNSQLIIHNLNANRLGTETFWHLEDIPNIKVLENFKDVLVSKENEDKVFKVEPGFSYPSGFLFLV
jgi:hypothetical protein